MVVAHVAGEADGDEADESEHLDKLGSSAEEKKDQIESYKLVSPTSRFGLLRDHRTLQVTAPDSSPCSRSG